MAKNNENNNKKQNLFTPFDILEEDDEWELRPDILNDA